MRHDYMHSRRSELSQFFLVINILSIRKHSHEVARGRPKKTWREVVKENCQARKLNTEDAMECSKWRKLIKDVR